MTGSRCVDRLFVVVAALALVVCCAGGCGSRYSASTIIGGRPVAYRSTTQHAALLKVLNQDAATFAVAGLEFTIDRERVTWGQDQSLALPSNWKRVDFIDEDTHIVVKVDGKAYGEIRPAA